MGPQFFMYIYILQSKGYGKVHNFTAYILSQRAQSKSRLIITALIWDASNVV